MARTSSNPAAAGFIVYGPQTALAVTLGDGTRIFTLHPEHGAYLGELMQGATGPHKKDFNTRWVASMVADAYRILIRGGV